MSNKFFDVYEELETLIDEGPGADAVTFRDAVEKLTVTLTRAARDLTVAEIETEYEDEGSDDFEEETEIEV
jgi:hypothetical protein